ncbi:MAG: T9SS type A sorting domain-containing protein [Chitinophagales bacterium]|nr:T9SS type A sorting domain-containing protein [Chitinophagales bacterium]
MSKKNALLSLLIFLLLASSNKIFAQQFYVQYDYDGAGNRILRTIQYGVYKPGKNVDTLTISDRNIVFDTPLQLKVYPNPFKETLVVENLNLQTTETNSIKVFDLSGKLIVQHNHTELRQYVKLSDVPPGTYYVNYYSNTQLLKTWKLVKL